GQGEFWEAGSFLASPAQNIKESTCSLPNRERYEPCG
ncbi:hypothetical protein LEMLEM_LOCUS6002, partial [Lemmus lemmus]